MNLQDTLLQAAKINDEITYQKKINPLAWHKLLPMQKKFAEDPSVVKFLFGGNRSGKSEGAADYIQRRIKQRELKYRRPQKVWVVGETYQDSVAIQQTKIWNLTAKNDIKYGKFDEINGFTNRKLQFKYGSLITFKSYDQQRESFQSDDIDLIWNDEEPPYEIYKEQRMRLLDRNGEMIISMTSLKGVTDLIDDVFEDFETIESQHSPLVDEILPRITEKNGIKFYFLWTVENPHISQERVMQEVEFMARDEVKSRILGIPINLTGKIYISMNKKVHVIQFNQLPEGDYTLYHILDPHDRKPWAMIWIAVHKTGTAYVVDEYPNRDFIDMKYDDKSYEDYAHVIRSKDAALKELFGVPIHRRIIDPNFGNKTVQLARRQGGQASTTPKKELEHLGFRFKDGIDSLEAGHLEVRKLLAYKRNEETKQITMAPGLMFVDTCHNTIRGMLKYSRKDVVSGDGDEKDKVGPKEKWKDFPDCVRYAAMSNLQYLNPKSVDSEYKKRKY